jgi:hypothetical protein
MSFLDYPEGLKKDFGILLKIENISQVEDNNLKNRTFILTEKTIIVFKEKEYNMDPIINIELSNVNLIEDNEFLKFNEYIFSGNAEVISLLFSEIQKQKEIYRKFLIQKNFAINTTNFFEVLSLISTKNDDVDELYNKFLKFAQQKEDSDTICFYLENFSGRVKKIFEGNKSITLMLSSLILDFNLCLNFIPKKKMVTKVSKKEKKEEEKEEEKKTIAPNKKAPTKVVKKKK